MPIYEYKCLACNDEFEALVFGNDKISCPQCKSLDLERLMSACGHKSGSESTASFSSGSSGCASCSSSNCSSCH